MRTTASFFISLFLCIALFGDMHAATGPSYSQSKTGSSPAPRPVPPPPRPSAPLAKPASPKMPKPYGMPGVVGLSRDKWVGTDYLGYLTRSISVNVEVIKSEQVAIEFDSPSLESYAKELLEKEEFTPEAEVTEGPPLPFLQVLLFIYPMERDKFVIFGSCRLFEQIKVFRKNFEPAGYWQGITWESQNVLSANRENLNSEAKKLTATLVNSFATRYKQFNRNLDKENNH